MLFDFTPAEPAIGDGLVLSDVRPRWGVDSEYGRLTDVMVSPPPHLEIVPCNSVAIDALAQGLVCCAETAERQHQALTRALEDEGVRCHVVPAASDMPDLSFTRDSTLMTPWGLLALRPALGHRMREVCHVLAEAQAWGVPYIGAIEEGSVEGGDICLLRPGTIVIGCSGERTNGTGAQALARLFERRGWDAIVTRFAPEHLHLDTLFTMLDRDRAVACVEALEPAFLERIRKLGVELIPVTLDEVRQLGANLVSLGGGRILSSAGSSRINLKLAELGYRVIAVEIDQFVRCGGGVHCLTMPLARRPA
ncbi:dimethylarginine dimethylaminohydrolase family protein [Sphingosinicella sp. LY1275]|uniref:dimethylarginine dimethylaminohydrolase family protein n=1 Tax=Sphingosinicella sp. LY1275 TaxID=3095379 RepID=UPI002ADED25F|nr:arginine deiminase family protein [Sphingosinicella sp. LY1275]MEA1014981.1 arginine deiminase family protein [Sphingosinicella sp. LY1275]